jgi:hypothetical protein
VRADRRGLRGERELERRRERELERGRERELERERWREQREQQRRELVSRAGAAVDARVVRLVLVGLAVDVRGERLLRRLVLQHVDQQVPGGAEHVLRRERQQRREREQRRKRRWKRRRE